MSNNKAKTKAKTAPATAKVSQTRKATWSKQGFTLGLLKVAVTGLVFAGFVFFYVDLSVQQRFQNHRWTLPARVYAKPQLLYRGLEFSQAQLVNELEQLGYRSNEIVHNPGQYRQKANEVEFYQRAYQHASDSHPERRLKISFSDGRIQQISSAGIPLLQIRLAPREIGSIHPQQQEDRILSQLDDIPITMTGALLAVEDQAFFQHHGVSFSGIARALFRNIKAGEVTGGGSTITQQLVKNLWLSRQQNYLRKGVEALMAISLEWHYSKNEILETYMNEVFVAQDGATAIHGFGLAAQYLFNRPVSELELHQQALIVAMLKGPSYYNPIRHPERARKRRDLVLDIMANEGVISPTQAAVYKRRDLELEVGKDRQQSYPSLLNLVRRQMKLWYGDQVLNTEGLNIYTTFDLSLQDKLQQNLDSQLNRLEAQHGIEQNSLQGAVVITQPHTGAMLALLGDRMSDRQGFNRALDAQRPIGSLAKPLVYLTAFEAGKVLTDNIDDSPLSVKGGDGTLWSPQNYSKESHGSVPLIEALSRSYNQATARLGMELGFTQVLDQFTRLGYRGDLPRVPAVMLGAVPMSPYDVAQIYSTLVSDGFLTPLRAIEAIENPQTGEYVRYKMSVRQVIDPISSHQLQRAMQETVNSGTARYLQHLFADDLHLMGKTGTTNDQRDSWFAGASGNYLGVVWVGRDDYQPTPLTGASGALRIWANIMQGISQQPVRTPLPEGMTEYIWQSAERQLWPIECQQQGETLALPSALAQVPLLQSCGATEARSEDANSDRSWLQRLFGR